MNFKLGLFSLIYFRASVRPSTCGSEGPNSNHIKPSCATNMLFSSVQTCPPWVRANVIPATQWHKINSKVAATIVNMTQWAMEGKIMFLQRQDWNQGRVIGKHNLSNSAVVLGRGGEVGGLLTEAQWSAAQRGAQFPAIPSTLGWALNAPLTPRWRRGHAASHLEPITLEGLWQRDPPLHPQSPSTRCRAVQYCSDPSHTCPPHTHTFYFNQVSLVTSALTMSLWCE